MTFLFPFNQQNGTAFPSQQAFEGGLKAESYGQFGFSPNNGTWHGGIHITHNNAPWLKDEQPLQAIADGVVVACRISDTYQQSQFDGHTLDYSHDFCLLQHKIEDPKGSGDSFTFFALYMHLAPLCAPHRAPSPLARYRLRSAQQGRLEATIAEGALSLPKGAIIEQVQGEAVKQDGYLFKPFTVISCANTPHIEGQGVWLATEKEGKPTDIRSNLFFECEFAPERGQTPISCLRLNRDSQVWFEANFSAPPMMLRHNSQLRALPLEAVRDGDYVLRAYELLNNSDYFKNPALQAGTQVWLVTAKYETMTELFDDYAQPYLVPNWLMTEVVGKTKVNLQGRGDPLSNGKGELTAGAVAFTLPKGTLIRYDKSRDCSIQIVNGQKRMMARCQIASTTPVSNTYGQTAKVVWLCVEEDYIEVVQTRTMALNQTHCFGSNSKLVVKAGEAIGYLGRFDCAPVSENNPINSNYQVHFELLSTIQPPEFFVSLFLGDNEKNKMAYRVVEDTANCDGYLDADKPSPFFNALSQIQSEDNNPVTSQMIAQKLKAWDSCKGVIAKHESEWGVKSQDKAFLNKLLEKNTKPEFKALIEHEKERIDNLIWLSDVSRLGISGHVWNWWPISNKEGVSGEFELGFTLVDKTQSLETFWQDYFSDETPIEAIERIKSHNEHLNDPVKQGEIVISLTQDPLTEDDEKRLSELKENAIASSEGLADLDDKEVTIINQFFDVYDYFISTSEKIYDDGKPTDQYAYASTGVGAATGAISAHLDHINQIIKEINDLYVREVAVKSQSHNYINYNYFITERAKLFKKLDGVLSNLSKKSINIPVYTKIKSSLKLSTKSVVHNADEIIASGVVPNLGKRMATISTMSKGINGIGNLALLLSVTSASSAIYDACNINGKGQCGVTVFKEVGGLVGGAYGGTLGGKIGIAIALSITATASAPVAAIVVVGGAILGGYLGGTYLGGIGKKSGELLYEYIEDGF